jgi:hypothetical protein
VHVLPVTSAEQALQLATLIRENSIHAVFVSSALRDMSPTAFVATMKERVPWVAGLPFVAMKPISQREHNLHDVFQYTLTKPIKQSATINVLCEIADPDNTLGLVPGSAETIVPRAAIAQQRILKILVAEGTRTRFAFLHAPVLTVRADNMVNQKVITWMLQHLGYQVNTHYIPY